MVRRWPPPCATTQYDPISQEDYLASLQLEQYESHLGGRPQRLSLFTENSEQLRLGQIIAEQSSIRREALADNSDDGSSLTVVPDCRPTSVDRASGGRLLP
jgi:hypothetical protein